MLSMSGNNILRSTLQMHSIEMGQICVEPISVVMTFRPVHSFHEPGEAVVNVAVERRTLFLYCHFRANLFHDLDAQRERVGDDTVEIEKDEFLHRIILHYLIESSVRK